MGGGCLLLLLWKRGFAKRKRGWEGWRRAGLGWVGEEWREKGLGWYIRRNTHTLGDCEKPHIALVVWDIYAYLIRLDMICEPFCHKSNVFRCFPYALVLGLGFFDFRFFSSLSREGFFFFLEREHGVVLFARNSSCKECGIFSFFNLQPYLFHFFSGPVPPPLSLQPPPPQPIVIIIIIDSLKSSLKPL